MTDSVNQRVRLLAGRYEIGALIGRWGMADVRLGTDARLGRRVAIKLLKPALAKDPAFRTRFDMILSVKEHEMHHRGQLMLIERILGIVPHLTREMQARMAAAAAKR